ncbi:MAG: tyrosine-type recombinase/integrase [Desulfomonilaceae bacterium]
MARRLGKIRKERGDRWYIELPGAVRVYCDKAHRTFYSRQHTEWTLSQIQGEIENDTFDADFYSKKRKSIQSFSVYAEEWLAHCEILLSRGELSPSYLKELRRFANKVFIPFFGNQNMREIKGQHLKAFYGSLGKKAPKTIFNVMGALHKIFADAVDEQVIEALPKFPIDFRLSRLPQPDTSWASEEEQEKIFRHLDEDDYFIIFFLATHGTRPAEARALKHKDINLKEDKVTIRRSFSLNQLREQTKNKRIRTIPLDPEWKELYLKRPRSINAEGFVFTRNGEPFSESWTRKKWNEARKRAKLAPITLYAGTRHSIASQNANSGKSLYLIGKLLGHSNLQQTARYSHLDTESLRQLQRKARAKTLSDASDRK